MSNWIKIDSNRLSVFGEERRAVRGVATRVLPSPYDIPDAVRVRTKANGRRIIEFRYINEEPFDRVDGASGIWLLVGQKTKRLYGIEIDVHQAQSRGEFEARIPFPRLVRDAIDHVTDTTPDGQRVGNFSIAKHALTNNREVFDELAVAGLAEG